MPYLLDTDVFIQAKNLHYGFDFCPAFWEWLDIANNLGIVFSIERVKDELTAGNDDLAVWAMQHGTEFFIPPDSEVVAAFKIVSNWLMEQEYTLNAITTFLQVADFYLIAHALAHNFVVVTHEIPAQTIQKVKIPNVCNGLGIQHTTPFDMLRREGARFVLDK